MVEFTKRESYTLQIAVYLRAGDYEKAYELAKAFTAKFPGDFFSHYLLSKSAFGLKRYEESVLEGKRSFGNAPDQASMRAAAILVGSAYFATRQFQKGYDLLKETEKQGSDESLEEALFIFSYILNKPEESVEHLGKLAKLNLKLALNVAKKAAEGK